MVLFFADDSTQTGSRNGMGRIISFGGFFIDPLKLQPLEHQINDICAQFNIPIEEEIKWSPKRGSWIYEHLHGEARRACYQQILQVVLENEAKALVVCWDTGRTTLQGENAFRKVLDFAFERISIYLANQDTIGLIIADRPGGGTRQDEQLLSTFLERVNNGTEHVGPERIALNILTTPSHLVRHLQVADLIVSITTAMVAGKERYAAEVFPQIKEMMVKNYLGYIGGTGLKLFPNDLVNLYYRVLDETAYVKVANMAGIELPRAGHPYYEDGL